MLGDSGEGIDWAGIVGRPLHLLLASCSCSSSNYPCYLVRNESGKKDPEHHSSN